MRLTPIEHPRHWITKAAYWMTRRQLGKVMTPMKVVYARMPKIFPLVYQEVRLLEHGLRLDPALSFLVRAWVAMVNDCAFCIDIAKATAIHKHLPLEKFDALADFRTHPLYTERERAALAYVEEVTRSKRVTDETFATLRRHFSEEEVVELTWLNALENYYNLINLPLGIESDGLCALAERRTRA